MTYQLIEDIRSNPSKLHKEAVINREAKAGNTEFLSALKLAFNPNHTFGVKKVPFHSGVPGPGLPRFAFDALADQLITRNLTGHAALNAIEKAAALATEEEWNGWYRLILTRDFRAGFSEATVNKAVKDVNKEFIVPTTPYMRCSLPDSSNIEEISEEEWAEGVYSQVKYDGMFSSVNVREDGFVWVTSRAGSLFPEDSLGFEASAAKTLKNGTQNHGEMTVYRDGVLLPRQIGNGILNKVLQGGALEPGLVVKFDCWDQIPLDQAVPKGRYEVPYDQRFAGVIEQLAVQPSDQIAVAEYEIVYSFAEAQAHYFKIRKRKLEGTILKRRVTFWRDGTSKDQIKFKASVNVELRVRGFNPGKGKNAHLFGSMICTSEDDLLECGVSAFSDKLRAEIDADRDGWLNAVVTVTINEIQYSTKPGKRHSAFLPRFEERRFDKDVADTFPQIEAQMAASIKDEK